MKKLGLFIVIALLLAAVPMASAETPAPGGPFNTAFRIQNLGAAEAECQFSFYDSVGVEQYSSGMLAPIPVGESAYIYVPDLTLADGQYAGVVSCSQEVAAVVNFSDPDSGASYSGVDAGDLAAILYAPGIYDNYYNYYSNVVIQNAAGAANDITIEIYEPGNAVPVFSDTVLAVPANGFVNFEQEGLTELVNNQFYSAKIMGTGDVAAIVNIYGKAGFDGQLYSYNPFAMGSTEAYAPVIMNAYYGYNTALVIQNMGLVEAEVEITYSEGTVVTTTIAPGGADSRYTPGEGLGTGLLTGAKVVSTNAQPIVLLVNESTNKNRAASYTGFDSGAMSVSAPIVMRRYYNYNTSVTCQNLGVADAVMSIEYGGVVGQTDSDPVAPDETWLFYQPNDPLLADNWIGSASVTSAEPIVCVVNEDMNEPPQSGILMDQLYAYNGIGQ